MIRCSSCRQSHWIYARLGKPGHGLEWLTGYTPYKCVGCNRNGWYRSHGTPAAMVELRRGLLVLSRTLGLPGGIIERNVRTVAGVLAVIFVLGISAGVLLFRPSPDSTAPSPVAAETAAAPAAEVAPVGTSAEPTPARDTAPAPVPPAPEVRQAVTPPVAAAPATVTEPVADTRVKSVATSKPAAPAAAPDKSVPKQAPAAVHAVRRQPEPARAASSRPKAARSAAPALPRYHGSLAVRSEPLGALVSVDGRVVGATPLRLKVVPAGSRVVRIQSEGYERWSSAARVVANKETSIVATLQRASDQ